MTHRVCSQPEDHGKEDNSILIELPFTVGNLCNKLNHIGAGTFLEKSFQI
jgi:hypothetical protein